MIHYTFENRFMYHLIDAGVWSGIATLLCTPYRPRHILYAIRSLKYMTEPECL